MIFQMLEHDMEANTSNLKAIVEQGRQMARAGHFDSAGILKAVEDFDKRLVMVLIINLLSTMSIII